MVNLINLANSKELVFSKENAINLARSLRGGKSFELALFAKQFEREALEKFVIAHSIYKVMLNEHNSFDNLIESLDGAKLKPKMKGILKRIATFLENLAYDPLVGSWSDLALTIGSVVTTIEPVKALTSTEASASVDTPAVSTDTSVEVTPAVSTDVSVDTSIENEYTKDKAIALSLEVSSLKQFLQESRAEKSALVSENETLIAENLALKARISALLNLIDNSKSLTALRKAI